MNKFENEILDGYQQLKDDLASWGRIVDKTINDTLIPLKQKNKIKIPPEFRLKDDKSYLNKALYRKKDYSNPLLDIEDKIGTRVVLTNTDDVYDAFNLLKSNVSWQLEITKNIRELIEEKPNQFDYQSIHLIVRPLVGSTEFDPSIIQLLSCEIQIRTLLQHAYAEVCHDTTYKGLYRNDLTIIRQLAKSMALMESVDDYFCNIFKLMDDEKREAKIYLEELYKLYKTINPQFILNDVDFEFTEDVFLFNELKKISIDELDCFIQKEKEIVELIKVADNYIFSQPTILLLAYYFVKHRGFLKDNWPFSENLLKIVYFKFGVAYE